MNNLIFMLPRLTRSEHEAKVNFHNLCGLLGASAWGFRFAPDSLELKMKLKHAAFAIVLIGIAMPAMAGSPVEGSGRTKSEAADDANRRAQKQADEERSCITPAKINECVKDPDGGYICTAYVANQAGSCP